MASITKSKQLLFCMLFIFPPLESLTTLKHLNISIKSINLATKVQNGIPIQHNSQLFSLHSTQYTVPIQSPPAIHNTVQIPAAWAIAFAPHAYAETQSKVFDNRSPRTYAQTLEKDQNHRQRGGTPFPNALFISNTLQTKARILRAEAAQTNCFENLALLATTVLAGNLAGLPAATLNTLSGGYLLSRVLYNFVYINNTSKGLASLRSVGFLAGIGQIFALFIKSANVLREKAANLL